MDYIFNESKGNNEITTILTFLDTIQTPVFLRNVDFWKLPKRRTYSQTFSHRFSFYDKNLQFALSNDAKLLLFFLNIYLKRCNGPL